MMPSFMRGWLAVIVTYCLIVGPAFADNGFKPSPQVTFCAAPERFDEVLKAFKKDGPGEAVRLFNFYIASGACIRFPEPVLFLGEKVVREYGDLSDIDMGKGNVIVEGVLVGEDTETKVYIWVDSEIWPLLRLAPEKST